MRRVAMLVFLASAAWAWAAPASAIRENDLAFAPEFGMFGFAGAPATFAAGDIGYGLGIAYGANNWIGVETDVLYSSHQQVKAGNTGTVAFGHLSGGLGPRFNWNTRYIVPFVSLQAAASFISYKATWTIGQATHHSNENAHGFGGLGVVGLDFPLHDDFTIGIAGLVAMFGGNLVYSNAEIYHGAIGAYGYYGGVIRLTLIF